MHDMVNALYSRKPKEAALVFIIIDNTILSLANYF